MLAAVLLVLVVLADSLDLAAAQEPPRSLRLQYEALLAGVKVGEATVVLGLGTENYEVSGIAVARGALEGFSDWRNEFRAAGAIVAGRAQPQLFSYLEVDRTKTREVVVRDGTLQVTKNGRARPPRPVPSGLDVLAGLFVHPRCQGDQLLHTGRHAYRVARLASEPGRCRLLVIDAEEDRYEVDVVFARRDRLVVPGRLVFRGLVNGSIVLREDGPDAAAAGGGDPAVDP